MSAPEAPYPVDRLALRALAHPLRSRLLAELREVGPATATDLARALETNSGATSYHLRRLAQVGLVRDARGAAAVGSAGRRRVWRAVTDERPLDIGDADDEDDDAALDWLARDYVQHFAERAQAWIGARPEWSLPWQEVAGLDDHLVLVTDEQLGGLRAEVAEVLARYRRVGAGNPRAKRVTFYTCALPVGSAGREPSV